MGTGFLFYLLACFLMGKVHYLEQFIISVTVCGTQPYWKIMLCSNLY